MPTLYQHKQKAPFMTLFIVAIATMIALVGGVSFSPLIVLVAFLIALVGIIFSSLTVVLNEKELTWFFGPGLWTYRLPLENIVSVETVRNRWWYGWGIRYTPHGWLYNVAGLEAIEILRKDGKKRRIGTDQPSQLAEAIKKAIADEK